ncbi:MAG: hypothetical protein VX252_09285, partial [Myxococcota bacterium]|nr:hypothetical protein [Myxococcota bacterium]
GKSGGTAKRNSNAIAWLDRFTRNPLPDMVIWEPRVGASERSTAKIFATRTRDHQRYWLDLVGQDLGSTYGKGELIIARLDRPRNTVIVDACGNELTILLTQSMLDLQREISVVVDGQTLAIKPIVSSSLLEKTLRERGDPAFMFETAVTIMKTDGTWTIQNRN